MPIIPKSDDAPVDKLGRATLLGIALFLTTGFMVARCLSPDSRGYGTHQQLGLPPCTMKLFFGVSCPGCGMTTCFAHFVRGQFVEAARANLAGVVLATVCLMLIPWSLFSARRGRLWWVSDPIAFTSALAICLSGLAMVTWVVRLAGFIS